MTARAARDEGGSTVDLKTRTLRRLSVSSVASASPHEYGGCARKFYFEKVLGYERGSTVATTIGTDVHAQIEHYLKTKEDTLGRIARQGKHFIPAPGPELLIEHEFGGAQLYQPSWKPTIAEVRKEREKQPDETEEEYQVALRTRAFVRLFEKYRVAGQDASMDRTLFSTVPLSSHGVPFVGYIDLVNRRDHWLDTEGTAHLMPPKSVELKDWKTSSNIELYGKRDLANTVQMIGYAEWARRQWPDLEYFRLSHGYFQTRGTGAEKRTVLISLDTLEKKWKGIENQVLCMTQVVRETDVNRIEPNYESCNAYGRDGCPHKSVCPRDPEKTLVDLLGGHAAANMLGALKAPNRSGPNPNEPKLNGDSTAMTMNMADMLTAMMQGGNPTPTNGSTNGHQQASLPLTPPAAVAAPSAAPAPPSSAAVEAARAALLAAEAAARAPVVTGPTPAQSDMIERMVGMGVSRETAVATVMSVGQPAQVAPAQVAPAQVAPAQVVSPPPVQAPPPERKLATICNGMVLKNRTTGVKIRFVTDNGQWFQQNVHDNGYVSAPAGTQLHQWYADTWEEVGVIAGMPVVLAPPAATVVPPDAPKSNPANNAVPIPPGTPLSPAVAAAAAQHAAAAAATPPPDAAMAMMQAMMGTQAPVAQAPVAQAPVAQAPVAQAPVAQAPVAQAPVAPSPILAPEPAKQALIDQMVAMGVGRDIATATVMQASAGQTVAVSAPQAPAQALPPAQATPPPAEAPRTRGRKGKAAGATAAPASVTTAEVAGSVAAPPSGEALELSTDVLTLFVDCASVNLPGVEVTDLDPYVANVCARLAAAAKLEDIRLGDATSPIGFGKWKGALAASVRAVPPSGPCLLRVEGSEIKQVVLETLAPMASGGVVYGGR